jgi:hypothetical protein
MANRDTTLYNRRQAGPPAQGMAAGAPAPANLADILERVLDKGIVIAGDVQINLLDIELLTIKLRLLVASVERAQEMGINWWESDPTLSSDAKRLERENRELRDRLDRLEQLAGLPAPRAGEEVIHEERHEVVIDEGAEREERVVETRHEDVAEKKDRKGSKQRRGGGKDG